MLNASWAGKDERLKGGDAFQVLGVDPGSHVTGFAVVMDGGKGLSPVEYGEIKLGRRDPLSLCLEVIYDGLHRTLERLRPDALAIEDIFYGKNVQSLIRQGHVRGVAILAGRHCGVPVYEYSPLEVKKAVVGYGRAEKAQVQEMVRAILKLPDLPPPDAADALAVAICHLHFKKLDFI